MRAFGAHKIASIESGTRPPAPSRIMGKGEMARNVRAFNWAATPLGPMDRWSPELVALTNLVLCSPSPARLLWGPDLILLYNDSYRALPGKLHPDALGKPAREVFKEAWNSVGPVLETAFHTGEPFVFDKRRVPIETGEGVKEFYLDCTYSPVYAEGKVAGLLGWFHDVTAEVNTSRTLEAFLNAIYSTSMEYLALTTPEGILIDCNRPSLQLAGKERSELIGKPLADGPWFAVTPGAPGLIRSALAAARAGETFRSELSLNQPDGETMVLDVSLTPVRDASGAVVFLVSEGRDITEEKRTEEALLKSEKLAAVGRLASSIAHEINNPLESVMNLIYLARNARPADAERFLDLADQEIRRVSIIANQTLRFHKQAAKPLPATAADLFSTVMSIYEGRLRNARVQVEKRFRTEQPVTCLQGDVRQVLNNLVSNALEAMPLGGRLLIRSRKGRDWRTGRPGLVLTIADNGTGIPPGVKKKIFDAFFTTKGTAGNGLGLWVCQEIVQRHHGVLRVRSTQSPGRNGTTFTLFLPFEQGCA
jgi:PAS domain S-box-containing protein